MGLEVVAQLAPSQDHCVEQLLNLWIACLSFRQHLADAVHRPLDRQSMALLLSFDDDHRADHLSRCGYVQKEGLAIRGWCENGGVSERCLQPVEGFLGFGGSREGLGFPQESIQG